MKKYIFIFIILLFIYFYFFSSDTIYNLFNITTKKNNDAKLISNSQSVVETPFELKITPNEKISTDIDVDINIDDIIFNNDDASNLPEDESVIMTENTNNLISNSYDELVNEIYKKVSLVINIHNKDIPIDILLFNTNNSSDDSNVSSNKLTNNFIELFKYYVGSTIFKFDNVNDILFMGDYLNNNGSANFNASRNTILVNDPSVIYSKFIPALSISMVGTNKHQNESNDVFIGCQFSINLKDITSSTKHKLIPFGKCIIEPQNIDYILQYYEKIASNNNYISPFIKSITLSNNKDEYVNDFDAELLTSGNELTNNYSNLQWTDL